MSRTETRETLIRTGSEIIAEQGFGSTGINAVLSTAGVPKGSFYHYFSSKEDFGLAVIEDFAADFSARLERFLDDPATPPLERIRNYLEDGIASMDAGHCTRGCLIGNLGQELSGHNEVFRKRLDAVFSDWEQRLARCLREAQEHGALSSGKDAGELAKFLLTGWEGAILRAKVTKSVEPMRAFARFFFGDVLEAA